jgi:hypothetical protein
VSNNVIVRHFTMSQTVIQVPFLIFSSRERPWFLLFVFFFTPCSDRWQRRGCTEQAEEKWEKGAATEKDYYIGSSTITNKRVSHRLGGGQSVNNTSNQHHHQQNQKVCHHRRAGKCNRFPCPSLHRELPAPPLHSSVNGGGGGGAKRGFIGNDSSINPSPGSSPFLNNSRFLLHLKGN